MGYGSSTGVQSVDYAYTARFEALERAKGAAGIGPIAVTYSDRNAPTLAELGLTKRDSIDFRSRGTVLDFQFALVVRCPILRTWQALYRRISKG